MKQASHGNADHDPYKFTDEELEYLYGYSKPNYPVPAIQYEVEYNEGFIMLCNHTTNRALVLADEIFPNLVGQEVQIYEY